MPPSKPGTGARPPKGGRVSVFPSWDDGFAKAVNQEIPPYNVTQDKYAVGYFTSV